MAQKGIEVTLLGQKIALKAEGKDPAIVQEVLELVSRKVTEAEGRSKGMAAHQIALLALMDLGEEYVQAKRQTLDFKQKLDEKSEQLLSLLGAGLA